MHDPETVYANAGEHYTIDEWHRLCLACPLPDCVRTEGEWQIYPKSIAGADRVRDCLICRAVELGLGPDEAVADKSFLEMT